MISYVLKEVTFTFACRHCLVDLGAQVPQPLRQGHGLFHDSADNFGAMGIELHLAGLNDCGGFRRNHRSLTQSEQS